MQQTVVAWLRHYCLYDSRQALHEIFEELSAEKEIVTVEAVTEATGDPRKEKFFPRNMKKVIPCIYLAFLCFGRFVNLFKWMFKF